MPSLMIAGRIARATDLQPLVNVPVRLVGPLTALRDLPDAQPLAQGYELRWTRRLSGFSGTRWDCWTRHVRGTARGLSWEAFCNDVLLHNPDLASDRIFKPDQEYILPEDVQLAQYTWSRSLSGFSGSRWDCWLAHVQNRVPGMTWQQFRDDALNYNPQLNADGRLFRAHKTYLLPEPSTAPRAAIETTSDGRGHFQIALGNLPTSGELSVELDGYARWVLPLVVNGEVEQPILLQPLASGTSLRSGNVRSARTDYATLPQLHRAVIDAALALLGDDTAVYDALPPRLQKLIYGARFAHDPNHGSYKDIVCGDVVSIALTAAGINIQWPSAANPNMADYYHPDRGNARLIEITNPDDWQPGDMLVYGRGDRGSRAGHVNLYVGPFTGADRSGTAYPLSANADVVEGSLDFRSSGRLLGTGVIGVNLQRCLQAKRGVYTWVRHVRLRELAAAWGQG